MTNYTVSPQKLNGLDERMRSLGMREADIEEQFIRGSGPGGQKINKTSMCVSLRHAPTGIRVRCQRQRSRALNRFFARRRLCDKIEQARTGIIAEEKKQQEKIRRQKRKRSKRAKEKMLDAKHKHAIKKSLRRPVSDQE